MWRLPLTFIALMSLGGVCGSVGEQLPGVEWMVLLSVPVFGFLVLRRVQFNSGRSAALVGFFAYFHGLAHGMEMPVSASIGSFGAGFVLATVLLHGLGLVVTRLAGLGFAGVIGGSAVAHPPTQGEPGKSDPQGKDAEPASLPTVVVYERGDSLIGIADSATQGIVGARQLQDRPILRAGEVLETIPGVIITQHAGGGKANQYFMRGFNLDHGTDFATSLDGMPINLPTHGHGQGYTDLNLLIPELIERVNYQKGVYYAGNGDFASAGAAHLESFKVLPESLAVIEGGMYGFALGVFAASPKIGEGHLLYGLELYHHDGPWEVPDDYRKLNGVLTYSRGDENLGYSVTARGYHDQWDSSDQVANSAVVDGLVPLFGSLIEDDSVRSAETIMLNARIGYRINKTWTASAEILNLLDRRDQDIAYYYASRIRPGDAVVDQVHWHPVEPIQARFALTARF